MEIIATAMLSDGTVRKRPVFAYPVQASYKGSGSINSAANFVVVMPKKIPDDHFDWLGADMVAGPEPQITQVR